MLCGPDGLMEHAKDDPSGLGGPKHVGAIVSTSCKPAGNPVVDVDEPVLALLRRHDEALRCVAAQEG
jgi:hypothetical protein